MKQLFGLVSAFISALALGLTACGGSVDVREPIGSTSHVDGAAGDDAIGTTSTANTTSETTFIATSTDSGEGGGDTGTTTEDGGGDGGGAAGSTGSSGGDTGTTGICEGPFADSHRVTISLAAKPESQTVVKKMQAVQAVGIVFVAGDRKAALEALTLTAQAQIGDCEFGSSPCAYQGAAKRITAICLYDENDVQVGECKSPDIESGRADFEDIGLQFEPFQARTLYPRLWFSSAASAEEPYDKVAIGINDPWDPVLIDEECGPVLAIVKDDVREQTWSSPTVVQTIRPSGVLVIEDDDQPQSKSILAGHMAYYAVARYRAKALYEDIALDRLSLLQKSPFVADNADCEKVVLATNWSSDAVLDVEGVLPIGTTGATDMDASAKPIIVPRDGVKPLILGCMPAAVQPYDTVPGKSGIPRSGHAPALGINRGLQNAEWDGAYADKLNVRATGVMSGERLYADGENASHGNPTVLRKAMPVIKQLPVATTTLADTNLDLFSWSESSLTVSFPVAWKRKGFGVMVSGSVMISNLRLRRGASDMDASEYKVFVSGPNGPIADGVIDETDGFASGYYVAIVLTNQEVLFETGTAYTLHGTIAGAKTGDSVTTSMASDWQGLATGGMQFGDYGEIGILDPAGLILGHMIYSDLSETAHSSQQASAGGSVDWFTGYWLPIESGSQTLSK